MIWLIAFLALLQTAPNPAEASRLRLTLPDTSESASCAFRLGSPPQDLTVLMRCRVTADGRAVDCEPEESVELSRRQRDAARCYARAVRVTGADGGPPDATTVTIPVRLALR